MAPESSSVSALAPEIVPAPQARAHEAQAGAQSDSLPREEQLSLSRRWRIFGDQAALDRLIQAHAGMVEGLARRYAVPGIEHADLLQEGFVGLITAARRFDPARGTKLATYAIYWVRVYMQIFVSRLGGPVGRRGSALHAAWSSDYPSAAELSSLRGTAAAVDPALSAEARLVEQEESEERRLRLARALSTLTSRERAVIEARHLREQPIDEAVLAAQLGLSPSVVRRLETRALSRLLQQSQTDDERDVLLGGRRITRRATPEPRSRPSRTREQENVHEQASRPIDAHRLWDEPVTARNQDRRDQPGDACLR